MKTIEEQSFDETNAYSLFVYAIRSQVTRDYYLRRLRIFFNRNNLEPDLTIEERCNSFANTNTMKERIHYSIFKCILFALY